MSSPNVAEIIQGDLPRFAIRRPSTFLSLAPTTSASYPRRPSSPPAVTAPAITVPKIAAEASSTAAAAAASAAGTAPIPAPTAQEVELALLKHRRSSSLASDESGSKMRFLKLGPVHWGEGDGTGDWSEVGVAEE